MATAIEVRYASIEQMINSLCWKFVKRFGGDFDEYASTCRLKFMELESKGSWQKDRQVKYSSFLYGCMQNALISFLRKESTIRDKFYANTDMLDDLPSSIEITSEIGLTPDGMEVVGMLCDAPHSDLTSILEGGTIKNRMSRLRDYLWDNEWDMPEITKVFSEIRECLSSR